jgi:uncharacterized protein (TIGR02284 family)
MAEKNENVISALNDLIETCKDAEQGFRTAAERAGKDWDPEFRTLLNILAQQRARFGAELQNEVLRRGGDPAKSGHVSAGFQRGWMNLNLLLTGSSEPSVLEECQSSELAAMRNYEAALKTNLPSDLFSIVEEQYAEIKLAHNRLKALERAYRAG